MLLRQRCELVGYAAPVEDTRLLGRGGSEPDDPAPRLAFGGHRPSGLSWGAALSSTRLSRRQLLITPAGDGALAVRSIGRCPLLVDGQVVESAVVGTGDTLVLHDLLVLLVVSRRPTWFLERRHASGEDRGFGAPDAHGIVGESPAAWELRESLARAALSGEHVLVYGESGTGKELAAQAVHTLSPRQRRAFVTCNAATLPEGLVDAELFGNARGYPQAGMSERPGLVGEADGKAGTARAAAEKLAKDPVQQIVERERWNDSAGAASVGDSGPLRSAPGDSAERQAIEAALAKTGGKVAPAAELLGMSRHALHRRLRRYGLRGAPGEGESAGG